MTGGTSRTVVLTERVPAPSISAASRRALVALVLAHLLLVAAVLADGPRSTLIVALLLCAGAEVAVARTAAFGSWAVARVGLSGIARMAVRGVAVVAAMSSAGLGANRPERALVLVGLLALPLSVATVAGLSDLVRRARRVPVTARGLPLAFTVPAPPPAWTSRITDWPLDIIFAVVAVSFVSAVVRQFAIIALAAAIVVVLVAPLLAIRELVGGLRRARRVGRRGMTDAIEDALRQVRPDVVVYFAGRAETLYQLTMWLPTFERLAVGRAQRRVIVMVRTTEALLAMPATSLPVVCVERGDPLLQLQWPPSLRLACYVSNASGNIHLLRDRSLRHVFIGHGDSDKTVSTGRYAKVYDEVWEAGPAGRARWRAADTGVDDAAVVEVGAPFLETSPLVPVAGATVSATADAAVPVTADADFGQPAGGRLTVAYAPTWEGVTDGADTTSVGPCGEAVIRRLVDLDVRVVYRPHPLTGSRDPRTAAAHRRILRLLGLTEPTSGAVRGGTPAKQPVDALDVASLGRLPSAQAAAEHARERASSLLASAGHVYAPAGLVPLDSVVTAVDAAVTDVSAALSAFLAVGIPVAVTNPAGLPAAVQWERSPMTASAYVVGPAGDDGVDGVDGVDALVAAASGNDPLAPDRARAREFLFGPPDPSSARFVAAVEGALRRARGRAG